MERLAVQAVHLGYRGHQGVFQLNEEGMHHACFHV